MSGGFSVFCLLANLPGPPQISFSNATLQLWSVNRRLCPGINPHRDTLFHLYTSDSPDKSKIIVPKDDASLYSSGIDFSIETIIFFHGFVESYRSDDAQSVKNGYLARGKYNVILVQNERLLAGLDYFTAAGNCKPIAQYSAAFIDYLVTKGLKLEMLHVIGLSLGGQIAGLTGQFVTSGKLPRITAFDPAGPLFNGKPISERIDPSDGEFVDVINTNSGLFGMNYGTGHVNYWPNGGRDQPGCTLFEIIKNHGLALDWLVFCSHFRSYQLYVESLRDEKIYPTRKCGSYAEYKHKLCYNNSISYMGIAASPESRGDYYIYTGHGAVLNG